MYAPTDVEVERRNRIRLSVAAFAYEFADMPVMTDAEFDVLARSIRPRVTTGNNEMDVFFRIEFESDTGMWIHNHPHRDRIEQIYNRYYRMQ